MATLDYNYVADLVVNAQTGDSDAFAELYAATYQRQYHFAYTYLKDEYLAQDALQETYIIALKNLSKLKDPMLLIAWLNQINFRVCFHLQKKRKRYDAELIDYDSTDEETDSIQTDLAPHMTQRNINPEDLVVRIDSKEYIMNQILKLPFTESQVVILKYYQELKVGEIARLMDISRSSVNRYLSSGKTHLEKILRQGGEFAL
ncbi:RNA polymerase sigma factor [bacterium 1xD8-48]|jgi:RNA polymerase sigma factor, sigma-70 family|nr:RNA polymerase sigma factor [Lachnospiraceae bacterium]NBJ97854.1 RNA polymerase sigma factor [bacterium 1xD8-48]